MARANYATTRATFDATSWPFPPTQKRHRFHIGFVGFAVAAAGYGFDSGILDRAKHPLDLAVGHSGLLLDRSDWIGYRLLRLYVPTGGGCPHCVGCCLLGLVRHHLRDLLLDAPGHHADLQALPVRRAARERPPLFSPVIFHHLHGRLLSIAPASQELEPPTNPRRFDGCSPSSLKTTY